MNFLRLALISAVLLLCSPLSAAVSIACGANEYKVKEGEPFAVEVVRSGDLDVSAQVYVELLFANGTRKGSLYQPILAAGETRGTVNISTNDYAYFGTFRGFVHCYSAGVPQNGTKVPFEMTESDPFPILSIPARHGVTEGSDNNRMSLVFSPPFGEGVDHLFNVTYASGTAKIGEDVDAPTTPVVVSVAKIPRILEFPIIDDDDTELNEDFTITFSGGFSGSTNVTLYDNDPLVTIGTLPASVNESANTLQIPLAWALDSQTKRTATVSLSGSYFDSKLVYVTFNPG